MPNDELNPNIRLARKLNGEFREEKVKVEKLMEDLLTSLDRDSAELREFYETLTPPPKNNLKEK